MFNAELSTVIALGLVVVVVVNVTVLYALAKVSDARIAAEVLKADKRLKDQIAAQNRIG